jgi:nitrite reductase (NO-forming)
MKESVAVVFVVIAFVGAGFIYKYTLSPYALGTTTVVQSSTQVIGDMSGMSMVPTVAEIGADPSAIPPPITRKENTTVKVALEAIAVQAELMPGVTYEYWTFNKQVPGPFIRVKEGDTVEVSLYHNPAGHMHTADNIVIDGPLSSVIPVASAHEDAPVDPHMQSGAGMMTGHETHSVDLHAVLGPGGGAMLMQTGHGVTNTFAFKALRPGIYIYHCASPHIPTHIANGMYGMILVEPKDGLAKVDHEYYVMQGEFYTAGFFKRKNGCGTT